MTTTELSPEALAAIDKVGKLLALARDARGNEHEAQNALDMAHRILEAHNLDMALVERQSGTAHAKRSDKTSGGGLYKWQRTVWENTAKLNMCVYFSIRGVDKGSKYENRLIGKPENVIMTTVMAEYLVGAIERLAAEWVLDRYGKGTSRFIREAIIFREGMADTIGYRLRQLHSDRVAEAKQQKAEAASTGTSLIVISDVIQDEEDLNTDYTRGFEPGTTANMRLEANARSLVYAEKAKVDAAKRQWWKSDPKGFEEFYGPSEAAIQMAKDRQEADFILYCAGKRSDTYGAGYKEPRSRGGGSGHRETEDDRRRSHSAFRAGQDRGHEVSLHSQVDKAEKRKIT